MLGPDALKNKTSFLITIFQQYPINEQSNVEVTDTANIGLIVPGMQSTAFVMS